MFGGTESVLPYSFLILWLLLSMPNVSNIVLSGFVIRANVRNLFGCYFKIFVIGMYVYVYNVLFAQCF